MEHVRSLTDVQLQGTWLTIGSFDGIHVGHQRILRELISGARAEGVPTVVLTFYPHPAIVLGRRQRTQYLTSPEERAAILSEMGIDMLITHPFNRDVAAKSAREFLANLQTHLGFQHLWVGYDFAMGHNREGNVANLQLLGEELGYQLHVVQPVRVENEVVSSSRIRSLLSEGEVERAASLLGRPYRLGGVVTRGEGRGRSLGIPTANLIIDPERAVPGRGVYACRARRSGGRYSAVANIGVRPTFDNPGGEIHVEAHLLDYDGDLYGETLQLEFISHLRAEKRFPDPQALVDQIHTDIARARKILEYEV